jgi:hypothetical protein
VTDISVRVRLRGGSLQNGSKDTKPPVPRTAPAADTEVAYVRQKGKWYQFRMKLEDKWPTAKDEYDSYLLQFKAEASVWQFNSKSGEYDPPVSDGSRPSSTQGLRFRFHSGKDLKLNMGAGNGGAGGGAAGWPNENFIDAKVVIDPSSFWVLSFDEEQFSKCGRLQQ